MRSYYEILGLPRSASEDEIKRSFRREIAKYHPDKVQHLGQEFQDIAAVKAAELTQAYKALSDPAARAEYDALLEEPAAATPHHAAAAATAAAYSTPVSEPPAGSAPLPRPEPGGAPRSPSGRPSMFHQEQAGAMDLVQKATLARFRQALEGEFGRYEEAALPGFEVVCIPKPPFWALRLPPRVLGRFVPHVDGAAVTDTWGLAMKMKKDPQRDLCVFLMGPAMASASELAMAISAQRRRPATAGKLTMIPVNTKTWQAHVPNDAPPLVKSLLKRLQAA